MAPCHYSEALSRALRLLTILQIVGSRRPGRCISRLFLADACGCSVKTIQRDLQELQTANIPIDYDPSERSYCLPEKGWSLPSVTLTHTDVLSLALMHGLMADASHVFPFAQEMEMALDKLTVGLPPALHSLMNTAGTAIADLNSMARDYSRAPVRLMLMAITKRQTVEMLYDSRSSGVRRRRIDPYRFDRRDGKYLELQAWCHVRKEVRTFALDRILEAHLTGETFELREWNASNEGVVGGLRGDRSVALEVCFDAVVAPFAQERRWPFTATFRDREDGSVVMTGEVLGMEGIVRELLSWRRHVQVLGGPELHARMVEEIQAMSALYPEARKN